jgi:predicted nucleotidyltransferase
MKYITQLNKVLKVLNKYLDSSYKVYLFGSMVHGDYNKRSDIDIFIDGEKPLPLRMKRKIYEEIEEIPVLVDVVFFDEVDDKFKQFIFKH